MSSCFFPFFLPLNFLSVSLLSLSACGLVIPPVCSSVFLTLNFCLPVYCSICLPSWLSVIVSVSFLPSCLPFHRSPVFLAACLFLVECLPACSYSWMPSFQKLNSNQTAMLFVKASVLSGHIEKPEVLWPEADIRLPLLCSLNLLSAFRAHIFKRLWSPGIDSKEWIPPACVAWRAGTITLFLLGS